MTPPASIRKRRASATVLAAPLALLAAFAPGAGAQEGGSARPDQVTYRNNRGNLATLTGRVVQNSLEGVTVEVDGNERKLDAAAVREIEYGSVPEAFHDGAAYLERGSYADAAASFRLAAADPLARPPVQAEARLRAAHAELLQGATEPAAFARAVEDAQRFLVDFPTSRGVPEARYLEARATRLAGDPAAAAASYRALYGEVEAGTPGYPPLICYRAGLGAAEALLAAGDTDQAREVYRSIENTLPRVLASLSEEGPAKTALAQVQAEARLGDGFCQLAAGQAGAARTFFEGQLGQADSDPALRNGALLGLAEALFAEGETREAQITFAKVSALEAVDRDRIARALVGLAECALELSDQNARGDAQKWVETVRESYGDTPAVLRAQELANSL